MRGLAEYTKWLDAECGQQRQRAREAELATRRRKIQMRHICAKLRAVRAERDELRTALESLVRVQDASDEWSRECIDRVQPLWPEGDRPGFGMICDRLLKVVAEREELRRAIVAIVNNASPAIASPEIPECLVDRVVIDGAAALATTDTDGTGGETT